MICNKCGKEVMPGARFCTKCGTPVEAEQGQESKSAYDSMGTGASTVPSGVNNTYAQNDYVQIPKNNPWKLVAILVPIWIVIIGLAIVIVINVNGSDKKKSSSNKKTDKTTTTISADSDQSQTATSASDAGSTSETTTDISATMGDYEYNYYTQGIIDSTGAFKETVWIHEPELFYDFSGSKIYTGPNSVSSMGRVYINGNELTVVYRGQSTEAGIVYEITNVTHYPSEKKTILTYNGDGGNAEAVIEDHGDIISLVIDDGEYCFGGDPNAAELPGIEAYLRKHYPNVYGGTSENDIISVFLAGGANVPVDCNLKDYNQYDYLGYTLSVYDLINICRTNGSGENCEVSTRVARYNRNGIDFLLIQCEKIGADEIETFIIKNQNGVLRLKYVQESWSRSYARFGEGFFKIEGSGGAGDYIEEYYNIDDDGIPHSVAYVETCSPGWIGDMFSYNEFMDFSTQMIRIAIGVEGDCNVTLANIDGYGILGYVEGETNDTVADLINAAASEGVTWTDDIDYYLNEMLARNQMVGGEVIWEPFTVY